MDVTSIIFSCGKIYNAISLKMEIENLYNHFEGIYSDISKAEFTSAQQAIASVEHSHEPEIEIRIAIGHLMVAFNIIDGLINKTIKRKKFLFFESTEHLINDKLHYFETIAHFAGLIAILFRRLNEYGNFIKWKEKALNFFSESLKLTYYNCEDLEIIDNSFVRCYESTSTQEVPLMDGVTKEIEIIETKKEITPKGERYIRNKKQELYNEFLNAIDNMKLELA